MYVCLVNSKLGWMTWRKWGQDGNKIMEMLDKIDSPTEYINAISKLLPYSIGKVKAYEEHYGYDHK